MAEPGSAPPASGSALGRKIGPLPLGAWIGIGAAVGLVWWLHARAGARTAAVDPGIAAGTATGGALANLTTPGAGTASGTVGASYADNQAWYQAALNALIATGYDPISAASALANYLAGAPLSSAEQGLVSLALGRTGAPPAPPLTGGGGISPLPPPPVPTPTPTPGPTPIPVGVGGSTYPALGAIAGRPGWFTFGGSEVSPGEWSPGVPLGGLVLHSATQPPGYSPSNLPGYWFAPPASVSTIAERQERRRQRRPPITGSPGQGTSGGVRSA